MAIGAAIGSTLIGAASARKASKAQEQSAANQLALQSRVYDETTQRFEPFYQSGLQYQNALDYELLGGQRPANYQGFQQTPGYQFQLDQGLGAIEGSAATSGLLNSGATLRSLQSYGQGLANQEYNTYLNRLTGGAQGGQAAAANQAAAGANYAAGGSSALAQQGNAAAAGAIGVGNALQTGIGNVTGLLNYQSAQNQANVTSTPWAAGGFWG